MSVTMTKESLTIKFEADTENSFLTFGRTPLGTLTQESPILPIFANFQI